MSHKEVKTLQFVLSQDKEIYPTGLISGYFGSATKKAVEAFQVKYGIVKKGGEGYGEVGPKTRFKINELLKGVSQR
jgi:peptidoglycan hydrolase-like protein with peptidoglycan-binding domain